MATYSGFLASNGLPELAEDGAVDFAAMTARRAVHVTLVDQQGVPVGTFVDDEPGASPDHPTYVANPDGANLRVRLEDSEVRIIDSVDSRPYVTTGLVGLTGDTLSAVVTRDSSDGSAINYAYALVTVDVRNWVGTLIFQGRGPGSDNFVSLAGYTPQGEFTTSVVGTSGIWQIAVAGLDTFRVAVSVPDSSGNRANVSIMLTNSSGRFEPRLIVVRNDSLTSINPNNGEPGRISVDPTGSISLAGLDPNGGLLFPLHAITTGDGLSADLQVQPSSFYNPGGDTFTGTTTSPNTYGDGYHVYRDFALQVVATGAVTSWTVVLEGSLDAINYTVLLTHTNVSPGSGGIVFPAAGVHTPCRYFRTRCSAIVLGGGTNVVAYSIGLA